MSTIVQKIQTTILQHHLMQHCAPVLVACSGGIDSMFLCEILKELNYTFGIAHVNFGLREDESEGDAAFVKQYAEKNGIPFHTIKFDTLDYKKKTGVSTQMAARELRYTWFEQIRKENGYHSIVTAHHLDDQIETVILNLAKGSGIKGIRGMLPKSGHVVRPLLAITKAEITAYMQKNAIEFREDSSNASDSYQRNQIRHHLLPFFTQLNENFKENFADTVSYLRDYELLTDEYLQKLKKNGVSTKDGITEIKKGFIRSKQYGKTLLYRILDEFGFNTDQTNLIYQLIQSENEISGKQFYTANHRLVVDRKSILIVDKNIQRDDYLQIDKFPFNLQFNNFKMEGKLIPIEKVNLKKSGKYAFFDASKITLPLLIRYPKTGDYFYPFGMSKPKSSEKAGKKKLSKYFKDEKLSLIEKENTPLLFSGDKLIWVIGHRTDDRFKVNEKTKNVLKFKIITKQ